MKEKALEVLKIFEDNGYMAYIVGGFVRDYIIGRKTLDIDICTNATPKEIIELFDYVKISDFSYGSVNIVYKNIKFDVTTFRKDIKYEDNRKPIKIKYISNLKEDLLYRWDLKIEPDLQKKYNLPLAILRDINNGRRY